MTEQEMRESEAPWPKTEKELVKYIDSLVKQEHDYGTCVYAMSLAAVATFNYVSHKLGVTGFQASCADLDILKRTRGMKGGFILLKAEYLLYPQYDLRAKLDEFIIGQRGWLRDEAKKFLTEKDDTMIHPEVKAHWERLAK